MSKHDLKVKIDHVIEWQKAAEVTLDARDIRDWAGLADDAPITPEVLREYVEEQELGPDPCDWIPNEGYADYDCLGVSVNDVIPVEESDQVDNLPPGRHVTTVQPSAAYV